MTRTLGVLMAAGLAVPALAADPAALLPARPGRPRAPSATARPRRPWWATGCGSPPTGSRSRAPTAGCSTPAPTPPTPPTTPARIDFRNDGGDARGQTWEGIWRLDGGGTLTIVDDAPDPAKGRPTDFAAPAGSGYVLLVFGPRRLRRGFHDDRRLTWSERLPPGQRRKGRNG